MIISGKGKISVYGCSFDLTNESIRYSIDIENHYIEFVFTEKKLNFKEASNGAIELLIEEGIVYTFYKCFLNKISENKCKLYFETSLEGNYTDKIDEILCSIVEFTVNATPIPPVAISFLQNESEINSANAIIKCKSCTDGIQIIIESKKGMMTITEFETIFYNLLDILFLGNGYYPYIIKEVLTTGKSRAEINRMHQSIYKKGQSDSHWNKTIAWGKDLNLNEIYPKYLAFMEKNKLIIPILRNVIHSSDIYKDLVLCNLIQCVEGYMRKSHKKTKFSKTIVKEIKEKIDEVILKYKLPEGSGTTMEQIRNSISGLVGRINQPNFNECLDMAIKINENTQSVFKNEIENEQLDNFISKSKNTRNQFSHMIKLKDSFEDGNEIYWAISKYSLLLRIIILADLNIKVDVSAINRYVSAIDEIV